MICNFCGRRLEDNATFCTGCGAQLGNSNMNSNMSNMNQPNNNNNVTYDYGNLNKDKYEKKKSSSTAIGLILALVVVVGLVAYAMWVFNSKEKKKDNNEEKTNNEEIINIDTSFTFLGYKFEIPQGFTANTDTYQNTPFIQSNDCLIMLSEYPTNYSTVMANKDFFISQLEKEGIKVTNFATKTINNKNYIVATGTLTANQIEYGYILTDLDTSKTIFATIVSSSLGKFNQNWFNYAITFIESAVKQGV